MESPGDQVEIRHGWVYVNGELLFEPYVRDDYRDQRSYEPTTVPDDSYFVLGDHRNFSNDSAFRAGAAQIHLRQSGLHLLAGRSVGTLR